MKITRCALFWDSSGFLLLKYSLRSCDAIVPNNVSASDPPRYKCSESEYTLFVQCSSPLGVRDGLVIFMVKGVLLLSLFIDGINPSSTVISFPQAVADRQLQALSQCFGPDVIRPPFPIAAGMPTLQQQQMTVSASCASDRNLRLISGTRCWHCCTQLNPFRINVHEIGLYI